MTDLLDKTALVTGASRGVGAAVAERFAARGADVVVNYRSKSARAEQVAAKLEKAGRRVLLAQADLTVEADLHKMMAAVADTFGTLHLLVLNASGGLEKGKAADYALNLNLTAQMQTLDFALPLMRRGGRVVFVTSHLAHFYGEKPVFPEYERVAASKRAGETALRGRMSELAALGISLVVVSGDLIEGTITPKLLERASPGLIETRRAQAGALPTVEDFAEAIVNAAADPGLESGATVYVGAVN